MISLFSITLGWLPAGGSDTLSHMILPIIALTIASIAGYTRHMRSAMITAMRTHHIRTARAKGLSETQIIWKHAFQHAIIPVVTIIALDFGTLFGGALVTETIFSWPGMGKMIFDSIMGNDFNLALCGLMVITTMILIGNLIADIAYILIDPRISFKGKSS